MVYCDWFGLKVVAEPAAACEHWWTLYFGGMSGFRMRLSDKSPLRALKKLRAGKTQNKSPLNEFLVTLKFS